MFKARKPRPAPAAKLETEGFTSSEVSRVCGVTLRQLQWWDERNVVSPRQDGHRRVYLPQEVVEISVIAELRRKGFSLQKIRRVLRFLQKEMGKRLSEVLSWQIRYPPAYRRQVHLPGRNAGPHHRLLKNARQPMFLVCVADQVRRLNSSRKTARTETAAAARKARAG